MRKGILNYLILAVFAISAAFTSCDKNPDDDNNGNGNGNGNGANAFIIEANVFNGNNYNNLVDEVRLYYHYDGTSFLLQTAPYKDGGFKMSLPETPDKNMLFDIEEMFDNCSVSDKTTKMVYCETITAYKNNESAGYLLNCAVDMRHQYIRYIYVDKDCSVSGEYIQLSHFKKGWNILYVSETTPLTTTKPDVDFKWHFANDITWM